MVAPEPYLSACVAVLREAMMRARHDGYGKRVDPEQLADLMDAIHNIPEHIQHWDRCDIDLLRTGFLKVYDDKWAARRKFSLCKIFDDAIRAHSGV
jgi:hypothetical protein